MSDKPANPSQGQPADDAQTEEAAKTSAEAAAKAEAEATAEASEAQAAEAQAEVEEAAEETAADEAAADEAAVEASAAPAKPKRTRKPKAKTEEAAEAPAEPAAKPKKAKPETNGAPPVVRAHAKYVRTSARKARLVCDHLRGKSVEEARAILAHTPRAVAQDWSKLLESAIANAEHNHELVGDELRILSITADEGPTIKRFRPRAMGRATKIRKRTSHLSIALTPKER